MTQKRAVIVGAGGMGKAWAKNLQEFPLVEFVGWADVNEVGLQAAAQELGVTVALETDFASLLKSLKPDFVIDVTPPEVHHEVVLRSLELGIPVLGEKPMAHSLEAAREMVHAADSAGKLYMVSQSRRYNPGITAFGKAISSLGSLGVLNADFYLGPHFGGFRDEMDSPLIMDMAIHTFDAARMLSGLDAESVYCEEFNPSWSWYQGNASGTALFTMNHGVRFTYRGSWCAEGCNTSWESEWRAVGENGSAFWDGGETAIQEVVCGHEGFIYDCETKTFEGVSEHRNEGIAGSLTEFLTALSSDTIPQGECHDNFKSLAMVFAAIESSKAGIRVPVPRS